MVTSCKNYISKILEMNDDTSCYRMAKQDGEIGHCLVIVSISSLSFGKWEGAFPSVSLWK